MPVIPRHPLARRTLGLWMGLAALAVQVLLPFLIAVEIRVISEDPFLFGGLDPALMCSHDSGNQPAVPKRLNLAACPLCTALAAGHAVTVAAAASLPPPREIETLSSVAPAPVFSAPQQPSSYDARGPPGRA